MYRLKLFQVISSHFRMNREVIETKCKEWINEMESEVQKNPSGSQVISDELILLKVRIKVEFFFNIMIYVLYTFL